MSSADVWMPLYIGDYLADTMRLSTAQHGAYLLLLMEQWRTGPLPKDEGDLARIVRCDVKEWRRIAPAVLRYFQDTPEGYVQGRLAKERSIAEANSDRRAEAGRKGAAKRWQSDSNANGGSSDDDNGNANATALRNQWPSPSPSPSPSPEEEKERPKPSVSPSPLAAARPKSPCGFDDFWAAYPRKVGKDAARRAWKSAMKRATVEEIAAGLNAAQWPADRQFIPHASTWLNAGRWRDSPEDVAPEKPGKLDYLRGFLNGKDSLQ